MQKCIGCQLKYKFTKYGIQAGFFFFLQMYYYKHLYRKNALQCDISSKKQIIYFYSRVIILLNLKFYNQQYVDFFGNRTVQANVLDWWEKKEYMVIQDQASAYSKDKRQRHVEPIHIYPYCSRICSDTEKG